MRDYADRNLCLVYGPNTPTTVLYIISATPGVLDIDMAKDLGSPIYLTTCTAQSSDHLPIVIDTQFRSSFLSTPNRPDLRREFDVMWVSPQDHSVTNELLKEQSDIKNHTQYTDNLIVFLIEYLNS